MLTLILDISYNGTNYHGLVRQVKEPTVYSQLLGAFERLFTSKKKTKKYKKLYDESTISCSGRTDKGVHARSMLISIVVLKRLDYQNILNRLLPKDIRINRIAYDEKGFSARFDCQLRVYRYYFYIPLEKGMFQESSNESYNDERNSKSYIESYNEKNSKSYSELYNGKYEESLKNLSIELHNEKNNERNSKSS
ncbi:Pseudouridylate synthase, partial [Pseudoloma neurophilia]